eukprot:1138638-Alexandrium_andersonii.AAC.1
MCQFRHVGGVRVSPARTPTVAQALPIVLFLHLPPACPGPQSLNSQRFIRFPPLRDRGVISQRC